MSASLFISRGTQESCHLITYLRRHHLALVAIVLALGGTAYAASRIGTKDIKNNSIRGLDIKNHAVTGRDVRKGSLDAEHLRASATPGVSSVLALGDSTGNVDPIDADGFTAVKRTGTGTYEFTPSGQICSVTLTPFESLDNDYPPVSLSVDANTNQGLTVVTADENGTPADVAEPEFGYRGFYVIATSC